MNIMTLTRIAAATLLVSVTIPAVADSHAPKGKAVAVTAHVTATIVAIDKGDRIVSVVGPKGNVVDIEAGDEVRNFDQIEIGDKVNVAYMESIAIYLGSPGTLPDVQVAQAAGRAEKGDKPAAMLADTVDISATVKGIDRNKREVKLQLADGHVLTTDVDESVKAFDTLKVGDVVHARMTRAVARSAFRV